MAGAPWGDPRTISDGLDEEGWLTARANQIISEADSVDAAMHGLRRFAEAVEAALAPLSATGERPDLAAVRAWIDEVERRHTLFQKRLAPSGWALSPVVQGTGHYLIAGSMAEKTDLPNTVIDASLAEWLLVHGDFEAFLNRVATTPLHAVWRWTWICGESLRATIDRSAALAAFGWMVIAEGMGRDLQAHLTGSRPNAFYATDKRRRVRRFGGQLVWSEASLGAAQSVLARQATQVVDEPIETATTNRHGFIHGNVAGAVGIQHAVKAFTLVDSLVEMAGAYVHDLDEDQLQAPPWSSPGRPIGSAPRRRGKFPGISPIG